MVSIGSVSVAHAGRHAIREEKRADDDVETAYGCFLRKGIISIDYRGQLISNFLLTRQVSELLNFQFELFLDLGQSFISHHNRHATFDVKKGIFIKKENFFRIVMILNCRLL
jgi:hypothetical protein